MGISKVSFSRKTRCEQILLKKIAEREHLEALLKNASAGQLESPTGKILESVAIQPLEKLIAATKSLLPYDNPELPLIIQESESLVSIRKSFLQGDLSGLEQLLASKKEFQKLPTVTKELANYAAFLEQSKEAMQLYQKLKTAIIERNKDKVVDLLTQAKAMKIVIEPDLFKEAMEVIRKMSELKYYKEQARSTKSLGIIQLAIQTAEDIDPKDPDIPALKALKQEVKELLEELVVALNVLEREQMEIVLKKATAMAISNDMIETVRLLLNEMDFESFEELQLKAAMRLEDKKLILKRVYAKKTRELMSRPEADTVWKFEKCPAIQDLEEWARKSFFGDMFGMADRKKGFLSFSKNPIHKPLSKITAKKTAQDAKDVFISILHFMGDKPHTHPVSCAQSIIHIGVHNEILRDEIYLQLMKQLTDNPSTVSQDKGWALLGYCLKAFSPGITQNYLEYFIRKHCKYYEGLLNLMYTKMTFEAKNTLQLNEIRAILGTPLQLDKLPAITSYVPAYTPRTDPQLLYLGGEALRQINLAKHSIMMGISRRKPGEEEKKV